MQVDQVIRNHTDAATGTRRAATRWPTAVLLLLTSGPARSRHHRWCAWGEWRGSRAEGPAHTAARLAPIRPV